MGYTASRSTWINPNIEYLFNSEIIEYDMREAGFNIIQHYKLLSTDQIKSLKDLDKVERYIAVGKLQGKDKDFSKALLNKFAEVRNVFISANDLTDNRIISVKKDAIYTIGPCGKIKFGKIEFVSKNQYSSYIRFTDNMNIEIYSKSDCIDIKGMGDSAINRHRLYMLEFIKSMISYLESKNSYIRRFLSEFIDRYKFGELDEEYYIEFNNLSKDYNPMYNFEKIVIPLTKITLREMT
jgi:hypothetical protein